MSSGNNPSAGIVAIRSPLSISRTRERRARDAEDTGEQVLSVVLHELQRTQDSWRGSIILWGPKFLILPHDYNSAGVVLPYGCRSAVAESWLSRIDIGGPRTLFRVDINVKQEYIWKEFACYALRPHLDNPLPWRVLEIWLKTLGVLGFSHEMWLRIYKDISSLVTPGPITRSQKMMMIALCVGCPTLLMRLTLHYEFHTEGLDQALDIYQTSDPTWTTNKEVLRQFLRPGDRDPSLQELCRTVIVTELRHRHPRTRGLLPLVQTLLPILPKPVERFLNFYFCETDL